MYTRIIQRIRPVNVARVAVALSTGLFVNLAIVGRALFGFLVAVVIVFVTAVILDASIDREEQ